MRRSRTSVRFCHCSFVFFDLFLTCFVSLHLADYDVTSYVYSTWSDAELRAWLVKNKVVSAAEAADWKRHQLEKKVAANYHKATSTVADSFNDVAKKAWLIKQGILKEGEAKAEDVEAAFDKHYTKASSKSSEYVSWSDARLRGWLRDHNVSIPTRTNRQELLQKVHENCSSSPFSPVLFFHF